MTLLGVTGHIFFLNDIFLLKVFLQMMDLRGTVFFEVGLEGFFSFVVLVLRQQGRKGFIY